MLMPFFNDRWLAPTLTSKKLEQEQPETRESEACGILVKMEKVPVVL